MSSALQRLIIYFCLIGLLCQHGFAFESDQLIRELEPTGSITDKADLLPAAREQELRTLLDGLEKQTGAALVVVTLPSMKGGQIDDFTNRLFEQWGVGQAGEDNGIMLLVAVEERKIRIEVGYGLEGVIPDGLAGEIRDTYILPYFRSGQMATGIESGALALANLVAQHYKVAFSEQPVAPSRKRQNDNWPLIVIIIVIVFFQIVGRKNRSYSNRRRYYGGGFYVGGSGGGFSGGSSFGGFGGGMSGGGGASGGW